MKYLSNYIQDAQTALFNETGTFFAFSQAQFNDAKKDDVIYVSLGAGMICPKENVEKLKSGLEKIHADGIAQDLAENGKDKVIERELHNHEAFYVGEIDDTCDALKGYGITRDEVLAVYNKIAPTIDY